MVRGWEIVSSVGGFGNESVVLNEGTVDYGFRPVDPELDECKRDPLVAFLFRVPNYYGVIAYMPCFPARNRRYADIVWPLQSLGKEHADSSIIPT